MTRERSVLDPSDTFAERHIGPDPHEIAEMLGVVGCESLEALVGETIPDAIRLEAPLALPGLEDRAPGEHELLARLRVLAERNVVRRSCIGMGYSDTIVPPVIQRNVLENPGWYTQYTPYQAEISQGRLEALLNFQTMVADLTGLPLANASLLDEATAAAEAMGMCRAISRSRNRFLVAADCHPQTIAVVKTRGAPLGVEVEVVPVDELAFDETTSGVLLQYPATDGRVEDYRELAARAHAAGALVVVAADLLALTLLVPPGEFGADIAVGSAQRFGVPLGYGGPHAAYLSTHEEHARRLPGRLVGVSRDVHGASAYRLAIQTREQHIRRDRATSNICTAQVLLANMAGLYAVYHGPEGLRRIARRVRALTGALATGLREAGHEVRTPVFFDTIRVAPERRSAADVVASADERGFNVRDFGDGTIGIALDETTTREDVSSLLAAFGVGGVAAKDVDALAAKGDAKLPAALDRTTPFLEHPVFHRHHGEHAMLRYLHRLEARDLSLNTSMIPLGSCTMKLNATSEMVPVTWPAFGGVHPFAPAAQTRGYAEMLSLLEAWLGAITGLPAVSLQPNAGSQGEFAGLLAIRRYHAARGDAARNVCLIPVSAHGTNAATAVTAGFRVVAVACDARGNVDVDDLRKRIEQHAASLGALMITYPSTHGVFEASVREVCGLVHAAGGLVYMDGANMNAQVGLTSPSRIGADVCHLNLHKTFCIPHGGGGPGMGPIAAAPHLAEFLPGHPLDADGGAVSAAPYGSASILPISWVYIALMGASGLTRATQVAILAANYMAKRLQGAFDVLFTGPSGRVAHEFIIDCRPFEKSAGVTVEDIAKRLMDYGFHAPTMSFPVAGTLMIEPTESEPKAEIDRLCEALLSIREEIRQIEAGTLDRNDHPLMHAPHTAAAVSAEAWPHAYSRELAGYPAPWLREHKYWPPVGRIDNAWGDRHLACTCPPIEELAE
ncbi:MAG: aminomethyl-transferring glycine dehydrogenase [Deltaproteobacteria bacterium]|nr:aminomethyl-transferring glycine dehydrogenase [Deltaproteobacteria bacterium]